MESRFVRIARWLLLLPLVLLVDHLAGFPFPSAQSMFSDLVISHYPNAVFLQNALREYGVGIPLWSPTILSGYPFFANPLSGLHYPPGWLALLLPLPFGLNLVAGLHLALGGWGFYRLLRQEGLDSGVALLGGISFGLLPKLFAHYGAGHLSLLYAVPWTPWLLLAARQQYDTRLISPSDGTGKNYIERLATALLHPLAGFFQPGILLGLIFLADPRWAVYAGLAWLGYSLALQSEQAGTAPWHRGMLRSGGQLVLASLVAAPLALPLLQYASFSTRAQLTPPEVLVFSLEPARLLGFFYPGLEGFHEWVLYSGGVVLVLAVLGAVRRCSRPIYRYYLVLAGMGLGLSLGNHLPGMEFLAQLPGFSLLRVPPRALFLVGLGLAGLAAHAAGDLRLRWSVQDVRRATLVLVALALLAGMLVVPLSSVLHGGVAMIWWGVLFIGLATVLIIMRLHNRLGYPVWLVAIFLLSIINLVQADRSLFTSRPTQVVLDEGQELVKALPQDAGQFRLYSPSYSLPQQTAARSGLELADGVDPLQLETYASFFQLASGVPRSGYSITLPPFDGGDTISANQGYAPQASLLGLLNVRYLVSAFPLEADGLELYASTSEGYIYENQEVQPRAWLQPIGLEIGEQTSPVLALRWSPNRIVIDLPAGGEAARGERLLVLSEIAYPGWEVEIDGEPANLVTVAGILRAVTLPPGARRAVFELRPISLYAGLVFAALGLAASLWLQITRLLLPERRGQPRPPRTGSDD